MNVTYKCRCMPAERTIPVTTRVEGGGIGEWMEAVVVPAVSYDHRNRNPLCRATALEYLRMPVEEGSEIGTQPTRN